jgi:hypothetical protein
MEHLTAIRSQSLRGFRSLLLGSSGLLSRNRLLQLTLISIFSVENHLKHGTMVKVLS